MPDDAAWPPLPLAAWKDTQATLHRFTQVVGKVRLALAPAVNHWWHVPLYVEARGLGTSAVPYGGGALEIRLDLVEHALRIETSSGASRGFALRPMAVADFHAALLQALAELGVVVKIRPEPCELLEEALPLDEDRLHASYDAAWANRFFRALLSTANVLGEHRSRFLGKSSPVHFFWGSFDLALTWFSGRRAPPRPGADAVQREAYSHEVVSFGFWPGGGGVDASFYAYAAPVPDGLARAPIRPAAAGWNAALGEFLLAYEDARATGDPRAALREFLSSTWEAAAGAAAWDRAALERDPRAA